MSCGDALVPPGDVIVADDDGVVVVPRLNAGDVGQAAEARLAKEAESRARYQAGDLGLDINQMRGRLAEKGLVYMAQETWEKGR